MNFGDDDIQGGGGGGRGGGGGGQYQGQQQRPQAGQGVGGSGGGGGWRKRAYQRDAESDPINPNPSPVVHVRNIHPRTTEADLIEALAAFGPVAYAVMCMPGRRMALVEFEDIDAAKKCVTFAATSAVLIAGQAALINFSTSVTIERVGLEQREPSNVLVLQVSNAMYPITVDVIKKIASAHGQVLRIAILRKTLLLVLAEFESPEVARNVKHAINGADIYSGCCTLKVEFARTDRVKVVRNDENQWDFTAGFDPAPISTRRVLLAGDDQPPQVRPQQPQPSYPQQLRVPAIAAQSGMGGGGSGGYDPYDPPGYGAVDGGSWVKREQIGVGQHGGYGASSGPEPELEDYYEAGGGGRMNKYTRYEDPQMMMSGGGGGGPSPIRGTSVYADHLPQQQQDPQKPMSSAAADLYSRPARTPLVMMAQPPPQQQQQRMNRGGGGYGGGGGGGRYSSYGGGGGGGGQDWDGNQPYSRQQQQFQNNNNNNSFGGGGGGNANYMNANDGVGDGNAPAHWSHVVMCRGIDHDHFTCDRIFNLLCCYGNCLKVKFFQGKTDFCLAEMSTPREVANVLKHLQGVKAFGHELSFRPSKEKFLRNRDDPFDLPNGNASYKDYSNSRNQRFMADSLAKNRILFPRTELHWFNAPPSMTEDRVRKLFEDGCAKGAQLPGKITVFNTHSTRSTSGLMEFDSVEAATESLLVMNHSQLPGAPGRPPFIFKLSYGGDEVRRY